MRLLARLLAAVVAAAVGLGVGVLGAFVHRWAVDVFGLPVPVGLAMALAGLGAVLVLTGLTLRSRLAVLAPALGWVAAVFPLAVPRPEGDLVVAGTPSGYAFLLGGALLMGICATFPYGGTTAVPFLTAPRP